MASRPAEWFPHLHAALGWRVPPLWSKSRRVQVTLHEHLVAALSKREEPAQCERGFVSVKLAERRAIQEIHAPFLFQVGSAALAIIGIRVGMTADPEVNRARLL